MSGFLAHLVGMALGEAPKGSARPSLPARFAPTLAGDDGAGGDWTSEAFLMPPARPAPEPEPAPAPAPVPDVLASRAAAAERRPSSSESPTRSHRVSRPPDTPNDKPASLRSRKSARSSLPAPLFGHSRDADIDQRLPAHLTSIAPALADDGPAEGKKRPPPLPPRDPSSPLSDAALASRSPRFRPLDPVIHVTIDRIDVRAPAPAPEKPTSRRPRMEPSVTLSDFLRGGGTGR